MAFVNEFIPKEDLEKYGIEEIDKQFIVGGTHARDWTIDRERNMYLRRVARGREELRNLSTWTFLWNDKLLLVELETLKVEGQRGEHITIRQRLVSLGLPPSMEVDRDTVIRDLKDALTAHKGSGMQSTAKTFSHRLDV